MGAYRPRSNSFRRRLGIGSTVVSVGVVVLLALATTAVGVGPNKKVYGPPFRAAILAASSLSTYHCGKAKQLVPWYFHATTGLGGAAYSASAKSCSTTQPSFGDYGSASASGGAEISVLIYVPTGTHNVSANLSLTYSATATESNGSAKGHCPTHALSSISGQYYNGTSWSYWPSFSKPIVYSNKTYYYYYTSSGAQASCTAFSSVQMYLSGFLVDTTGTASFGVTPSSTAIVTGYVETYNYTYWDCSNYTQWNYGSWTNGTPSCSSSNTTTTSFSYNYATGATGGNTSMTSSGLLTFSMWARQNYSASHHWLFFLDPSISTSCYTTGWVRGSCSAVANLATLGNGLKLNSITVT